MSAEQLQHMNAAALQAVCLQCLVYAEMACVHAQALLHESRDQSIAQPPTLPGTSLSVKQAAGPAYRSIHAA